MPVPAPHLGSDPLTERVLDAALALVAEVGVGRLSLAEVARSAGCSRATLYRVVPGGKAALLHEVAQRELARFLRRTVAELDTVHELEDALVVGLVESARWVQGHAALQRILVDEPEVVLPFLGFTRIDRLYRAAAVLAAPAALRFVEPERAVWVVEWVVRTVVSYAFNPSDHLDLADPDDARRLVRTFLLPALAAPVPQAPRS